MYLILADQADTSAAWTHRLLRSRGLTAEFVTPPELIAAARWEHRVGREGVTLSIRLQRGLAIDAREVRGVLNRIGSLPLALFAHMRPRDRTYALQEMTALLFSSLRSMNGRVLNQPGMRGLCGAFRDPVEWSMFAARAGLRTRSGMPGGSKAVVIGGEVFGLGFHVPEEFRCAAAELSKLAETPLLGLEAGSDGSLAAVTPKPEFHWAGPGAVDALLAAWEGAAR